MLWPDPLRLPNRNEPIPSKYRICPEFFKSCFVPVQNQLTVGGGWLTASTASLRSASSQSSSSKSYLGRMLFKMCVRPSRVASMLVGQSGVPVELKFASILCLVNSRTGLYNSRNISKWLSHQTCQLDTKKGCGDFGKPSSSHKLLRSSRNNSNFVEHLC